MKKLCLSILPCLATLVFFTAFAYSAEPQISAATSSDPDFAPASDVAVDPALLGGDTDVPLVDVMINLLDSKVMYSINKSTQFTMAYSPFADLLNETHVGQPASNVSVGLKFSF